MFLRSLANQGFATQNFQNHVRDTLSGDKLKKAASEAAPFFRDVHDFVFGRAANMENIVSTCAFLCV